MGEKAWFVTDRSDCYLRTKCGCARLITTSRLELGYSTMLNINLNPMPRNPLCPTRAQFLALPWHLKMLSQLRTKYKS